MNKENTENSLGQPKVLKQSFQSPFKQPATKIRNNAKEVKNDQIQNELEELKIKVRKLEEENEAFRKLEDQRLHLTLQNEPQRIRKIESLALQVKDLTSTLHSNEEFIRDQVKEIAKLKHELKEERNLRQHAQNSARELQEHLKQAHEILNQRQNDKAEVDAVLLATQPKRIRMIQRLVMEKRELENTLYENES